MNDEILNALGNACKSYIHKPQTELRISIALARNAYFQSPKKLYGERLVRDLKKMIKIKQKNEGIEEE